MAFSDLSLQIGSGLFDHPVFDCVSGLFLLLVGAASLSTLVIWRVRGLQVDGKVIGLHRRGRFHGVCRYAAARGLCEATSVQGRITPRGLETGAHVPIQVMPDRPDEARERHAPMLWALAIGSLVAGGWLLEIGVTVSHRSSFVWMLIARAMVFTVRWPWRHMNAAPGGRYSPRDGRPGKPDTATIDHGWSNGEPLAVMGVMPTGLGVVAVGRR